MDVTEMRPLLIMICMLYAQLPYKKKLNLCYKFNQSNDLIFNLIKPLCIAASLISFIACNSLIICYAYFFSKIIFQDSLNDK